MWSEYTCSIKHYDLGNLKNHENRGSDNNRIKVQTIKRNRVDNNRIEIQTICGIVYVMK